MEAVTIVLFEVTLLWKPLRVLFEVNIIMEAFKVSI